jgi:S-adenosyl methyltransferase
MIGVRWYDYLLGGKDNSEADRITARAGMGAFPNVVKSARAFLARVRYLAEPGIRQFLDIRTGLPSAKNVHEVARSVAPTTDLNWCHPAWFRSPDDGRIPTSKPLHPPPFGAASRARARS